MNKNVKDIGLWSSALSLFFALCYCVTQLLSTAKLIPHPQDLFWLFLPSLFLAPAFLVSTISLHYAADKSLQLYTALGIAFALLYCVNVTQVYFTQLAVVVPAQLKNLINEKEVLLFDRKTFLMAVDCLGYFFMSMSTFFTAFAFRKHTWLYRGLLWNGLLMPILILAYFYPAYYYIGALWMISFPLAMINATRFFFDDPAIKFNIKLEYEDK